MSEIEKFNPHTLAESIKERIKSDFVQLIPQEQWDQMVKSQIDALYMRAKDLPGRPRTHMANTEIDQIIHDEITKIIRQKVREQIKREIDSPEWGGRLTCNGRRLPSEMAVKIARENGTDLLMGICRDIVECSVDNVRREIANQLRL